MGSEMCIRDSVTRIMADELFEAAEGIVWSMQETARDVLQRLLEGRDGHLRERSDGSIQVSLLEKRDNLGVLTGQYFVTYQRAAADEQWASAMVAWGAEEWVMVSIPGANRMRWTKWQTPHIYDRETLRKRAMHRLRKLWALKDLRAIKGPFDARIEVGDELTIDSVRGIPAGQYMVRSIEITGDPKQLDMNLTVQALPSDVVANAWPIKPGVDQPATGERYVWETPDGALKKLYDDNAIDVYYGTPSDYAAGNGATAFGSYVVQEFDGSLFIGLSNTPMNGTGAIIVRLDEPGGTPIFEYNMPEEGVANMAVNPAGTALYIAGVDARGPTAVSNIFKRDLAGVWTQRATITGTDWWHVLRITWIGDRMFIAGQGTPHIAYSDDDGVTWTYVTDPGALSRVHQLIALDNSLVLAGGGTPYAVYRSIDDGATWSTLLSDATAGNSCQPVIWRGMVVCPIATDRMVTIDSAGVLTEYTLPFVHYYYYNTLVVDSEDRICALSATGVWRSSDLVEWKQIWLFAAGDTVNAIKTLGTWGANLIVSTRGSSAKLIGTR